MDNTHLSKEMLMQRVERNTEKVPFSGCWLWVNGLTNKGYARASFNGETSYVHRWTYQYYKGQIPKKLSLDHLCRVPSCVNPSHLEPVTHRINVLRGIGPTAKNAQKHIAKMVMNFQGTILASNI